MEREIKILNWIWVKRRASRFFVLSLAGFIGLWNPPEREQMSPNVL